MPATPSSLSAAQVDTLYRWFADGYTDTQIQRMIAALAASGERDDDENLWPTIARQTIAYHRKKLDTDGYNQAGGELLKGTIVGTRDAILRRYARQMGEVEMILGAIESEMTALEQAGALIGHRDDVDEPGTILGSVISVDGEPLPGVSAIVRHTPAPPRAKSDVLHPDVDPLFQRYVQLGHLHAKELQGWQRIVQDAARVAGLGFPPNAATPPPGLNQPTARESLLKTLGLDG